ncbi:MAG TPA: hypothetical protein VFU89_01665 [Rhabdochlamydiaceae bacterium]|nr:hypothetical protein [Rhabdochlamydiaceae bacterium]
MRNTLQNLLESLQKYEIGKIPLPEIAEGFVRLFDEIHLKAEKIPSDQKEEFATQTAEDFHQLVSLINPYIDIISLSDEQLLSSLENPSFFDANDWNAAIEAKEQIGELARKLFLHMSTTATSEESQELLKKEKKHPPRTSKSQWMKS